ncbi:unnamed protein product [Owenia fusiformis]|uniref:Uncharacterized protein n=2 Tax=Owenia fusiformis TaxID=6347 RepID=A0A8J1XKV7_OWEFU|nr:unnamed protein product [Owenia fusiformis]
MQDDALHVKSTEIGRIQECRGSNMTQCIRLSMKACNAKKIIVTKTVRSTMESIRHLLSTYSNCPSKVNVVHLVRDPRAMLKSRQFGRKTSQLITEADALCKRMYKDVLIQIQIKKYFPDSIHRLRYEDLAEHPQKIIKNIYRHLQMDYTKNIDSFIAHSTTNKYTKERQFGTQRRDSNATAYAWKKTIEYDLVKSVDTACHSLYKELGYLPIQSEKDLRDLSLVHREKKSSNFN